MDNTNVNQPGLLSRFFQGLTTPETQGLLSMGSVLSQRSNRPRGVMEGLNAGLLAGGQGYEGAINNNMAQQENQIKLQQMQNQIALQKQMQTQTPPTSGDYGAVAAFHRKLGDMYTGVGNAAAANNAYKEADRNTALDEKSKQLAQMAGSPEILNYQGGITPQSQSVANDQGLLAKTNQFARNEGGYTPETPSVFSSLLGDKTVGKEAASQQDYLRSLVNKKISADPAQFQQKVTSLNDAANRANSQAATIAAANNRQEIAIGSDPKKAAFASYMAINPNASPQEQAAFQQSLSSPRSPVNQAINAARTEKIAAGEGDLTSDEIMGVIAKNATTTAGQKNWVGNGQGAKSIESLNKIGQHLDYVNQIIDSSGNSIDGTPVANWAKNKLGYELGGTPTTNLDVAKQVLTQEVQKFVGGGGTSAVAERQGVQSLINNAQNKQQMKTAVEAYKHMIGGQIDAVNQHYIQDTNDTGGLLGGNRLLPQAKVLLQTYGSIQPTAPQASAALKTPPTDADLQSTALKYGMSVDAVKKKLGL